MGGRFWVCIEVTDLNIVQKSTLPGVLVSGFGGFFPDDQARQGCSVSAHGRSGSRWGRFEGWYGWRALPTAAVA